MTETPVLPSDMPEENGEQAQDGETEQEQAGTEQGGQKDARETESIEAGAADSAGIDTAVYEREFLEQGSLSEESYKALAAKGISKELVERYIEGRKAYVQNYDNEIMNTCGGESEYKAMAEWAAENLSEEEKASFNNTVNSRDMALAKFAVSGLYARYKQAGGAPNFIEGTKAGGGLSVYKDTAEVVQDKKDERYEKDAQYRKKVDEKIRRSILAGAI